MFHITSPVSILKLNAINMFTVRNIKSENGSPRFSSLPVIFSTSDLSMFFQFRDTGSRPYLLLCVCPTEKIYLNKIKKRHSSVDPAFAKRYYCFQMKGKKKGQDHAQSWESLSTRRLNSLCVAQRRLQTN